MNLVYYQDSTGNFLKYYTIHAYEKCYEFEKHEYYFKNISTIESYLRKSIEMYCCSVLTSLRTH